MAKKRFIIHPPPQQKGLYRVIYSIDINASNVSQAAQTAFEMMQSKTSLAPVLVVIDGKGRQTTVDLVDTLEFNKITARFVCQKFRKNSLGKYVCIHQEFVAGEDAQIEDHNGDPIEAPEHDDHPFNMTLLSQSEITDRLDEILSGIDVGGEQSRQFASEIASLKKLLEDLG